MKIELARSLSGHDKNQVYLVNNKDEKNVYLVNGTTRTLLKPKKKNIKHVQIIKKLPEETAKLLEAELTDLIIKRAIKEYNRRNQENVKSRCD
jgi:hypothetical protein